MKRIFWVLVLFSLLFLFFPSHARAADCSINVENRATLKDGDRPIFIITNTSATRQKFFIRFQPVGASSVAGYQICHNPSRGIDLILEPGEVGRVTSPDPLTPYISPYDPVISTFKLQGFLHTNDQCGELTVAGHLRCEGADFSLQPKKEEGVCKITTSKEAVMPGESFTITLTNTHPTENIGPYNLEIQPPGTFSKYNLPGKSSLGPGKTQSWQTAVKQGGTDKPDNVYIRAKSSLTFQTYCTKTIYVTIDPESLTSYLEGFRPQPCDDNKGIQTALGCIPTKIDLFVSWLFGYGISIAGGIAFLMIIFSTIQMITSAGDPEKLQKAKQMLGSAIAGLLFIIFAVFLLRIIGVDILQIF